MNKEPVIAVGLVENVKTVSVELCDEFADTNGTKFSQGKYFIETKAGKLRCLGKINKDFESLSLFGTKAESRFRLEVTIGIDFHWMQKRLHTYSGNLRFLLQPNGYICVINDVPLERYILSVCCSEMNSTSPQEFLKAHSIISRSWLLAQLESRNLKITQSLSPEQKEGEIICWYDRRLHDNFDVCADDHCQRYQGIDMIASDAICDAVQQTRGLALVYKGKICDARFCKCCGGVTEDFTLAWADTVYPYLKPVFDGPDEKLPSDALTDEQAARNFIMHPPCSYCNCSDEAVLKNVLNDYDRSTHDFFRWHVRLKPEDIARYVREKLSIDLGRIIALEPVERGFSARLKRLRIIGDKASVIVGKELQIRRVLSPTHLYSSAFVVDVEGPFNQPKAFVLHGAGWGHGVGLCQIGAAVMASKGARYLDILHHYYKGCSLDQLYR